MDVMTAERKPMAKEAVMNDVLDQEERVRQATSAARERFLPTDVPREPSAFFEPRRAFRVDESELAQLGSMEAYLERAMIGGGEWGREDDTENKEGVKDSWKMVFSEDCPYDFDDPIDGEIQMQMAGKDIEEAVMSNLARGEIFGHEKVVIEAKGEPVDVSLNFAAIRNRSVREALKHRGEEHVGLVWENADSLTLYSPYVEGWDWVIRVADKDGRFLAMSLKDFKRMLMIGEKNIDLPKAGNGTYFGARDLILAIKRLRIEGATLPKKIDLALELLR